MHWILLLIAVAAFAGAIFAPSQGLIVVGSIIGFAFLVAGFVGMISARIAERSRPDSTLLTDADVNALRKSVREARAAREARKPGPGRTDPGS
jgi:FtsH-binding integral membrane protein